MHFVFRFTSCFGVRSQGLSITDTIQITTEIYYLQEANYGVLRFFFYKYLKYSRVIRMNQEMFLNISCPGISFLIIIHEVPRNRSVP